jgi:hypothetical protein
MLTLVKEEPVAFRPLPWTEVTVPWIEEQSFGEWQIDTMRLPLLRGYFRGLRSLQAPIIRLKRGDTLWMSTTPMELESMQPALHEMSGHVVIAGGGLGVSVYNALRKRMVSKVTMVEIDPGVANLIRHLSEGWPNKRKLEIVVADALDPGPIPDVDFLWADIWMELGSSAALQDVLKIYRAIPAGVVAWWGMELDFLVWMEGVGSTRPPTEEDWDEFAASTGLPIMKAERQWRYAVDAGRNVLLS